MNSCSCLLRHVVELICCVKGSAAVHQQQNTVSNTDQLDAANNNATEKPPSSNRYSDVENNNIGFTQSSIRGPSTNSGTSQEPDASGGRNCPDDGIEIMPYADFVRSRVARGLPPPRGVVVRRSGRHTLVPQYVVQHHRQHKAHIRSLRRHGYESEDGRIVGQHHDIRRQPGYDSDQHHGRHHHRRRHGYDSDVGYRSDVAGYTSGRPGPHSTVLYPSIFSSDFVSGDYHYGSDRDIHSQKTTPSSSFVARPGHNIPSYQRDVRETIAEEVMDCDGQPDKWSQLPRGQEWPSSVEVLSRSRPAAHQHIVNPIAALPYDAERSRRNILSNRRRHFEPIEL